MDMEFETTLLMDRMSRDPGAYEAHRQEQLGRGGPTSEKLEAAKAPFLHAVMVESQQPFVSTEDAMRVASLKHPGMYDRYRLAMNGRLVEDLGPVAATPAPTGPAPRTFTEALQPLLRSGVDFFEAASLASAQYPDLYERHRRETASPNRAWSGSEYLEAAGGKR